LAESANGKTGEVHKDQNKFDWVTERAACSLPKIFIELRKEVEEDVKTRNAMRPKNSPYEFRVEDQGGDFLVVLAAEGRQRQVHFSLKSEAILALNNEGDTMFELRTTFNTAGQCKLHVKDQELELWQARRMALEGLMFEGH
jgi:hypothetical protein